MKVAFFKLFLLTLTNLIDITFSKKDLTDEKESRNINLKSNFYIILMILIPIIYFFLKKRKEQKDFQKYIDQENSKPINYINNGDEIRGEYSKYIP